MAEAGLLFMLVGPCIPTSMSPCEYVVLMGG